jgi:tetratricopeptide (TPR) repeat protein
MLSITLFKYEKTTLSTGPSVTAFAYVGSPDQAASATPTKLVVPWHDLPPKDPNVFQLLSWHTAVSRFAGRDVQMAQLDEWADAQQAVSVKFITSDGGMGKSRLAAEFATGLQSKDWAAGFVNLRKPAAFALNKQGSLLIIDYPEENRKAVAELIADLATFGTEVRLRVLFLTRQPVDAWYQMIGDANAITLLDPAALGLGRLDDDAAYELFCTAQERAAEAHDTCPIPIAKDDLAQWLKDSPENERALFIAAAAVHSAIQPQDNVFGYKGSEVIDALIDRELFRLQRIAKELAIADDDALARTLAIAAITDQIGPERLADFAQQGELQLGFADGDDVARALANAGLLSEGIVEAPKPDIVAAALTVKVLSKRANAAPELLFAALTEDIEIGLDCLARLSYDAEVILGLHQDRLSHWLANAVAGRRTRCKLLEPHLWEAQLPLGLVDTAIVVGRTLLDTAANDEERASLLNNLSNHLAGSGDNTGALKASREAVDIRRRLAASNPARYDPDLAMGLNNLSSDLSDTGDDTGALNASRESVEIRRRLAESNPARFEPDLSYSLNNLSVFRSYTGDNTGALEAVRESVDICRRLAASNPARFEPYLARSLNNLSNRLSDTGDDIGALEAIRESLEIRRRLVASNRARFEPDLAVSLNNLSGCLSTCGDDTGALEAIRESVDIYRRLAASNPARFEPGLASSLNNLSNSLSDTGDYTGALEAIRESVDIRRRLAASNPARFEPDLARSLSSLGVALRGLGRRDDAMAAFAEGIDLITPFAQKSQNSPHARLFGMLESDLRKTQGGSEPLL